MTKREAVETLVNRDFQAIPTEWVQTIAEKAGDYLLAPMWGTMFLLDDSWGEKLKAHSRYMLGDRGELLDDIENSDYPDEDREKIKKAISEDDWSFLENFIDEEMSGAYCILDTEGNTTAAYIYEVDGRYLIGVNGAGFSFYDGVWDKIYDVLGLQWHDTKCTHFQCGKEAVKNTDSCEDHTFCDCPKVNGKYNAHYKSNCPRKSHA